MRNTNSLLKEDILPAQNPPTNKNVYPVSPKTPNHHNKAKREMELQIPPKHTLPVPIQTHKCSNHLRIPEISAPFKDFTARIPRILGFQRLRIRDTYIYREKERLGLAIFDAFAQGPFSFY
jgi:hypothetical protein